MGSRIRANCLKIYANLMAKYGSEDLGNIDIAEIMQDLMEVKVKENNKITMPHGLDDELAREAWHILKESLQTSVREINMMEIASAREEPDV